MFLASKCCAIPRQGQSQNGIGDKAAQNEAPRAAGRPYRLSAPGDACFRFRIANYGTQPEVWKCIMADNKDDKDVKDEAKPIPTEDLDNVSGGYTPIDGAPKPYSPIDG